MNEDISWKFRENGNSIPFIVESKKNVNEPLWRIASYVCDIINVRDLGDVERTTPEKKIIP